MQVDMGGEMGSTFNPTSALGHVQILKPTWDSYSCKDHLDMAQSPGSPQGTINRSNPQATWCVFETLGRVGCVLKAEWRSKHQHLAQKDLEHREAESQVLWASGM